MDIDFLKYNFEDAHDGVITRKKFKIGVRHLQMLYMILCSAVFGALRACNGVTVLAMTDESRQNETYIQIHDWDRRIQGAILSSFFFGYALMLLPAQLYLKNVGSKFLLTSVLLIDGALCVAMPTIVNKGGWVAVCNAQLLMGMTQACLIPANQSLIAKWLPPNERRLFSILIYSGVQFGIVIALPVSGLLSETDLGWELIFYAEAMMAFSMATVWGLLTSSKPGNHQAVGDTEKEFINETLSTYRKRFLIKPWRSILKSRQFWAVACAHASTNAVFVFYLADLPAYLHALRISLRDSAAVMIFPFLSMWTVYMSTSPTIDWIHKIGCISYVLNTTYFRKFINAVGVFGIIISLTIIPNIHSESTNLLIVMLTVILGLLGFQYNGFLETLKDMSQNFPGTLLMLTSSIASVAGAGVPIMTGFILGNDMNNMQRWRIVFLTLATFSLCCNIVYTVLGRSDRQEWDGTKMKTKFVYLNEVNHLELENLEQSQFRLEHEKYEIDTAI